ncbi:hypothetical protein [Oligoflexus tunisiensis]|uniref:hypothetical protein n=1 Tax=Oligoflexus tunisiensis TaxID=708132 RepID=UPI00114D276B|nr:hypothetical protein [Oligoflexus tunisiensis]
MSAAESVPITKRDLLVVSNLETHGKKEFKWLYRFLDVMSVSLAEQKLKDSYRHIYVLAADKASLANFTNSLESITQDPDLAALDVFIHLHGAPDRLWFQDRLIQTETLGTEIQSIVSHPSKLRALYSTACYGKSHAEGFLNAGFSVVNGAEKVNTNSPHDYPAFMNAWKSGATFDAAQEDGNSPEWIAFYDSIAQAAGFDDVGSYKVVEGDGQMTINEAKSL